MFKSDDKNEPGVDAGLLFLRVAAGGILLYAHGWPKLSNFAAYAEKFSDPLGVGILTSLSLAVFAEFFCSILLMLGLFGRLAAVPMAITMLVAAFIAHADDPFAKKEKAVVFAVVFIALALTGPGRYSLSTLFKGKNRGYR